MEDVVAIAQLARLEIREVAQRAGDVAVSGLGVLSRPDAGRFYSNDAAAHVGMQVVLRRHGHMTRLPRSHLR